MGGWATLKGTCMANEVAMVVGISTGTMDFIPVRLNITTSPLYDDCLVDDVTKSSQHSHLRCTASVLSLFRYA